MLFTHRFTTINKDLTGCTIDVSEVQSERDETGRFFTGYDSLGNVHTFVETSAWSGQYVNDTTRYEGFIFDLEELE